MPNGAACVVGALLVVLLIARAPASATGSPPCRICSTCISRRRGSPSSPLGQTLAILTGGIDLSVGSLISVAATLTSGLADNAYGGWSTAIAAVLVLSVAVGLLNGVLILWLRVHPLIGHARHGALLQGAILYYSTGPAGSVPDSCDALAYGRYAGIPVTATVVVALYFAVSFFMRRARHGRYVYMVGDDEQAATLHGHSEGTRHPVRVRLQRRCARA